MWLYFAIIIVILFVIFSILRNRLNNFVFISRNLIYIYEILNTEHKKYFPSDDTMLITSGVIDTLRYNFSIEELRSTLERAKSGECYISNLLNEPITNKNIELIYKKHSNTLLNFILEIEILIFLNDSSFSRQEVVQSVLSNKKKIEKAMEQAKTSYESGRKPTSLYRVVSNFMTSGEFETMRNEIGIIPI